MDNSKSNLSFRGISRRSTDVDNLNSSKNTLLNRLNVKRDTIIKGNTEIDEKLYVNGVIYQYGYELLPKFTVMMFSGTAVNIPDGWLLCDGRTVTINGVSVTAPDLRGRFVLSLGQGPLDFANNTVGGTGGAQNHTLSITEIPSHSHTQTTINDDFNNTGSYVNYQRPSYPQSDSSGTVTWTNTINNTGGGGAHNNMPPYYVLCFIMKGF